jgi:hypothetical protein
MTAELKAVAWIEARSARANHDADLERLSDRAH